MAAKTAASGTGKKAPPKPHCKNCTCDREQLEVDARWNDAVDWLLNSRHTADPDIQRVFWGVAGGHYDRDEAEDIVEPEDFDG